ncbi:MAG: hypothetical protein ABEJ89_02430 [Haloarculaceae archaeon]
MGGSDTRFDALLLAAVASISGAKYLVGAMLELLSETGSTGMTLIGSVPVTVVVGMALVLSAGALAVGQRWARTIAFVSFVAVVAFGAVTLFDGSLSAAAALADPVLAGEIGISAASAVYLLFYNPVPTGERSEVDESTSATRIGSTLR